MWKRLLFACLVALGSNSQSEGQTTAELLALKPLPPMILAPAPGMKRLATNGKEDPGLFAAEDRVANAVRQWRTNTKIVYLNVSGDFKKLGEHEASIVSLAWSPDGNSLATGDESGVVKLWNIDQQAERLVLKGPAGAVRNALFSPNGSLLVTGDGYARQSQRVFTMTADKQIYMLDYIYLGGLSPVMGTPEGNKLSIWDATTGKLRHELKTESPLLQIWFSPDSAQLWTTEVDRKLTAWDVATGNQVTSWLTPKPLLDAVFSPDGDRLYTLGHGEHLIRVWQRDGKAEPTLKVGGVAALRRPIALQISDDGKHLMAETGLALNEGARTVQALRLPVAAGTLTVSERLLALGTSDDEVNIWKLPAVRPSYVGPRKTAKLDDLGLQNQGTGFFSFPRR